ncbi:Ig-like domain-containing protein, partial [Salegentibacter sp. HM20]
MMGRLLFFKNLKCLLFLPAFFVLSLGWGQTVTSDKDDYAPGEIAIITGEGWVDDDYVDVHLHEDPEHDHDHSYHNTPVNADGTWRIKYPIEERHLGVTFTVEVVGKQSGATAETVFTDAGINQVSVNSGSIYCIGQMVSVSFNKTAAGGSQFPSGVTFIAELINSTNSVVYGEVGKLVDTGGGNGSLTIIGEIPITTPGSTYRIRVRSENPITNQPFNNTNLTIISSPSAPIISDQNFCNLDNPTVASLPQDSGTFNWYSASTGGNALEETAALNNGTYYVSRKLGGCESERVSVEVTVTPNPAKPTINANSSATFCPGDSVVLTSSASSGNQWYKDGVAINNANNQIYEVTESGSFTVIATVNDCASDESDAVEIMAEDKFDPTAIAQNVTIYLDANGEASVTAAQVDNGSSDNCGVAILALDITDFTCSNVGDNDVVLTVTDVNGKQSTAHAVVTVVDNINPTAIAQNVTIYLDANGEASVTAAQVDNGSSDNCGLATFALDITDFTCSDVGDNDVVLTVTDVNGKQSTANAVVTVVDNIYPTAIVQNVTIYLDGNGEASVTAAQVDNGSSDNCGLATLALDITDFTCSNVGDNDVVLTVTDVNGKQSTAHAVVTVVDNINP